MAATLSSAVFANTSGVTTITFTGVALSSGQTLFVYLNSRDNGGANYASATWNGSGATADETENGVLADGMQFHQVVFRGLSAATASLVITMSAAIDDFAGWCCVITDADQTTTLGATGTTNSTATGVFTSGSVAGLSTTANDLVFNTVRVRDTVTLTEDGGQTLVGTDQTTANGNSVSLSYEAGTGSASTTGYTFTNPGFSPWAMDAVVIKGVGGGGSAITGTGAATSPAATASGTAVRGVTDSGGAVALTAPLPTISGTGTVAVPGDAITGTGAITSSRATLAGVGVRGITGTGALTSPKPTISGTNIPLATGGGDSRDRRRRGFFIPIYGRG